MVRGQYNAGTMPRNARRIPAISAHHRRRDRGAALEPVPVLCQYRQTMTPHRKTKTTYLERQAARAAYRAARDVDIQRRVKAGAPLVELGREYDLTRERVRQIARGPAAC